MTDQQRDRYAAAWARCFGEMTALDEMLSEYPKPAEGDEGLAMELEDLARRIGALTACWEPVGDGAGPGIPAP